MSMGAAFVQRVSGFGFGIFIMTVLPFIMPSYGEATTLSGLLAMLTSIAITLKMWRHIPWKTLLPILLTFLIVSYFSILFVARADEGLLKHILGVVLILVSIYFFFISERIKLKPTLPIQIGMGTISGLMGGFFGMQGPPAVLFFVASSKTKEEYMSMMQCYLLVGNVFMTIFRARQGFLTEAVGYGWLCGICGVIIGFSLGTQVYKRLSLPLLRKVIYAYMAISGILALI